MTRRYLTLAALVVTSVVVAACTSPTAPRPDSPIDPPTCKIFSAESGKCLDDEG
jgi:hypothetical protein